MKCHVRYIAVVDKQDRVHAVEFGPGVNVITGKSSTGKSAMIEIFDYCFGSEDFTVPEGIITATAQLFVVVLAFADTHLVLGRRGDTKKAYIREETDAAAIASPQSLNMAYFAEPYFLGLAEFKKELGRFFQLSITDVDENLDDRKYRRFNAKSPAPSVRSFASFMLQHQNLVANKHAVFYRFDEMEKREQAIEHLKVFLGYADQKYFLLSQRLNEQRAELRKVELQLPRQEEERRQAVQRINDALREYAAVAGAHMVAASAESMVESPARWLEELSRAAVRIDGAADGFGERSRELEGLRSVLVADLRTLERQRDAVRSSIAFAGDYLREVEAIDAPGRADISVSACPFCGSNQDTTEREANRLHAAIEWLNNELQRSPYMRDSFEADEQRLVGRIAEVRSRIAGIQSQMEGLDRQIVDLERRRPMTELAIKAKLRVEGILEELVARQADSLEEKRKGIEGKIKAIEKSQAQYHMKSRLDEAGRLVELAMATIGSRLDFEESYRPINLKFSLESFDLWHEVDGRRVLLRAMGSGANWLYCHISLFLALHKLFCSLGDACKIPPILFLDQPSQVYFPSVTADTAGEFDAKVLAEKAGRASHVDDDLRAVQNLYSQLVRFCRETLQETGVEPQIIVTDHADNLALADGMDFSSLVRAKWRTRGFIHPVADVLPADACKE